MSDRAQEVIRITSSMTAVCVVGAALLGAVFVATDRYQVEARTNQERAAIVDLLGLDEDARVSAISQYLVREDRTVIYRRHAGDGDAPALQLVFDLDGVLQSREAMPTGTADEVRDLEPLGRLFVAEQHGSVAGFVIEGEVRGYKNRIGFFVGLNGSFEITGVRVLEHEEDPGLGAEIKTDWFQGQYVGRSASELPGLTVTRDPMPENWRAALLQLARMTPESWEDAYGDLARQKRGQPVHAITGATISSQALTDGVRSTVGHFRKRWELLAPHLEEPS